MKVLSIFGFTANTHIYLGEQRICKIIISNLLMYKLYKLVHFQCICCNNQFLNNHNIIPISQTDLAHTIHIGKRARVAQWVRSLDYLTTHTSLSQIWRGFTPCFINYKKGALDSQPQVIKFTSCLPMVSGSLRVPRLFPPLKWVAMI